MFDNTEMELTKSICCWYDLLGYGSPFVEASWNLTAPKCKKNLERVMRMGSWRWGCISLIYGPKLLLNDGVAACIDLHEDVRSVSRALDYLEAMIADYQSLRDIDEREGNPGIRGVISCGDRFDYDSANTTVTGSAETITFYHPKEFQMNTAFSKAFIIEESGKKAGVAGSNLYIDYDVFELLNSFLSKFEGSVEIIRNENEIVAKIILGVWYATLHFDKETVLYKNKGIDTELFRFIDMESYPDDLSREAAYQQAVRYSMMEDDDDLKD